MMRRLLPIGLAVLVGQLLVSRQAAAADAFPDAPGPWVRRAEPPPSFASGVPIVGTYYFYWYDVETGEHFVNGDGTDALTRHPARREGYRYRDSAWHERELLDILAAGIDFILPVYWGWPGDHDGWSFVGLPPLVEAARRLEARGIRPPRIGCFYDTSTLRYNGVGFHADLRTERGKEWLYVTARDFYSLIPPDLRAAVDGRPLVWLYSAAFARAQDPAALDHLRASFLRDFGVEPYIVKEVSWQGRADATYAWGGALAPRIHDVAAVGPGYDHTAVPGRAPLIREREDGRFYRRAWETALRMPRAARPWIAVVETWNEWHEGTDVAPSVESGRYYVELTREYADRWRRGEEFRPVVRRDDRLEVSIVLDAENRSSGLEQSEEPDGVTRAVRIDGKPGRATERTRHSGRYLYFDVDDAFWFGGDGRASVEVEYLDVAGAPLRLEYDSSDPSALLGGAFKGAPEAPRSASGEWRVTRFELDDASFVGRANGNDFRLVDGDGTLVVHRVLVRRAAPPPQEAAKDSCDPVLLNDDGAWCWFQDERALIVDGKVIVGSVADGHEDPGRRGSIEVISWDLSTGVVRRATLAERLQRDDHAAPALLRADDGHLLAVFTRHGNDARIHIRRSERPNDATTWSPTTVVEPSARSRVTYSNLVRLEDENDGRGRIYDLFRGHDDSFKPSWMTSDDDGATWTPRGLWIDFPSEDRHRPYVKYASNGVDEIHFVFTEAHPHVFDNSLYHAFYRDGAFHRSDGERIAPVEAGPITPDRATRIFAGDADQVAWSSDLCLDEAGRPVAVYSVQKGGAGLGVGHPRAGADHRYRYARHDGERWHDHEIAFAGSRLYRGEDDYTGGICVDPNDVETVYLSTNVHPSTRAADPHGRWQLWRGRTRDLGATWSFERLTNSADVDNLRPIVPPGATSRTVLLWMRGSYHTYTRWQTQVVGLTLEREGEPPAR